MTELAFCHIPSPIGPLLLAGDDTGLHFLSFPQGHKAFGPKPGWHHDPQPFIEARRQLEAYFEGRLHRFDLPLRPRGTPFQCAVWALLAEIPLGETQSYGALASRLGRPGASRAVGAANGANPLPVILPCHRVVGASGALTGFGGGLPTKAFLLRHEAAMTGKADPTPAQLPLL